MKKRLLRDYIIENYIQEIKIGYSACWTKQNIDEKIQNKMSDNDRSLNDSKGLELDLDNSISMIEYALDDDDCCSSDNQVQISNNSSPGFVAVVPVIEITNTNNKDETLKNNNNNSSNKNKIFKKNSKVGKANSNHSNNTIVKMNNNSDQFDSGYSMKDVNSTTNLLGLDESSIITSDSYLNVPKSKYSFQNNNHNTNNNNTLLINAGFNSNSQSSIEPNGRYCKDVDSIPLVTLTSKLISFFDI